MTRAEKIAKARRLRRDEGLSYAAVGRAVGQSAEWVRYWISPGRREQVLVYSKRPEKQAAVKRWKEQNRERHLAGQRAYNAKRPDRPR